jgi:hypothetical protein
MMSLREDRKKTQRSLMYWVDNYPADKVLPELVKVRQTVDALIRLLELDHAQSTPTEEDTPLCNDGHGKTCQCGCKGNPIGAALFKVTATEDACHEFTENIRRELYEAKKRLDVLDYQNIKATISSVPPGYTCPVCEEAKVADLPNVQLIDSEVS